jgi:hypothetical protein
MKNLIEKYKGMRLDCAFRITEVEQNIAKVCLDPRLTLNQRREKLDELGWIKVAMQTELKVLYTIIEDLETL